MSAVIPCHFGNCGRCACSLAEPGRIATSLLVVARYCPVGIPSPKSGGTMATAKPLSRAPIQEALLDILFQGAAASLPVLEDTVAPFREQGWTIKHLHMLNATLGPFQPADVTDAVPLSKVSQHLDGVSATSSDETRVIMVRPARLTVSRVNSYDNWEELEAQTEAVFDDFVPKLRPTAVRRIAARFINRVPPNPRFASYGELLERAPQPLPSFENARISNFLRRHVVEDLPGGCIANLSIGTVVPEPGEDTSGLQALVIDIDVYKVCTLEPSFEELRGHFRQIRDLKNMLFFGSLTEHGLEQFA